MTKLPNHLFLASDGDLYDTRLPEWSANPLREGYSGHGESIKTIAHFKAALRAGAFTDLGGYPLYFVMGDYSALSFDAARENYREIIAAMLQDHNPHDDWRVVSVQINHEDSDLYCSHSGKLIPSAYGDDEPARDIN